MTPVSSNAVGLYVHFPFCEKKCPYCDFNSHVLPHDDERYADAIIREIEDRADAYLNGRIFSTLYFGGGTPSLWDPRAVGRVIRAVRARFGLGAQAEITLEANPGTVHEALFERFVAEGVGRFSIGAQSFVPAELVQLGRIHDAVAGEHAVRAAKATGARVSLDLIYAQPGQRWADVARSIERALALAPDHLSAYTLTVEPGTPLGHRAASGAFVPLEDDAQAELIEQVTASLARAGYERYEVSSYAPPGLEAVHNTLYWVGADYLGVGAGAHSHRAATDLSRAHRRANVKSPVEYEARALAGDHQPIFEETLSRREVLAERLMLGVRVRWGLDLEALGRAAGIDDLPARLAPWIEPLISEGLLSRRGDRVAPTDRGFLFTDGMGRRLLEAAEVL